MAIRTICLPYSFSCLGLRFCRGPANRGASLACRPAAPWRTSVTCGAGWPESVSTATETDTPFAKMSSTICLATTAPASPDSDTTNSSRRLMVFTSPDWTSDFSAAVDSHCFWWALKPSQTYRATGFAGCSFSGTTLGAACHPSSVQVSPPSSTRPPTIPLDTVARRLIDRLRGGVDGV